MHGHDWRSVYDDTELPVILERWKKSLADGMAFEMVFPLKGADGIFRPFLTRVVPLKDANGAVIRWIGTNTDISQLHEKEMELRKSEARYRSAMVLGRMAAWETDFVERTRLWTPEGSDIFGLNLKANIGKVGGADDEYLQRLHPEDRHMQQNFHDLANKKDTFSAEYRIILPDGTIRWMSGYGLVTERTADGHASKLFSIVIDISERKAMETKSQFLIGELSHRSKNLLTVIKAIAGQTARASEGLAQFQRSFGDRLTGMAASIDLLTDGNWSGAPLAEIIRKQLAPFTQSIDQKVLISGDDIIVNAEATNAIGLAIHELTTNALKYGALSTPSGKLSISWSVDRSADEPVLRLIWLERGGPQVKTPSSTGFGQFVIKRMIQQSLSAVIDIDYGISGLEWTLVAPLRLIVAGA